jgi:hypothetical protein
MRATRSVRDQIQWSERTAVSRSRTAGAWLAGRVFPRVNGRVCLIAVRGAAGYAAFQWQCTACPLPSQRPARAGTGDEDKGPRLAGIVSRAIYRGGLVVMAFIHGGQTRADPPGKK